MHTYIHTYNIHTTYIHTYIHTYIYTYTYTYTHTYTYNIQHTYIHTYTHTHIYYVRYKFVIFVINLAEQPRITFQLTQPIRVEEMTRIEIPCIVEGSPYPEVKWFNVSGTSPWYINLFQHH